METIGQTSRICETPQERTAPKMLLHACCGPCTLEPSRILREQGYDITVFYANGNIWPAAEYDRRLSTLQAWAATDALPVVAAPYDPDAFARAVAEPTRAWRASGAGADSPERAERCRACYRQRFERAAAFAAEHGYGVLATTLSVSPYQHTAIIREELERAAAAQGLQAHFVDFRPNYAEATRRSRALGMYRQNYCGCELSYEEAAAEREERKAQRAAQRAHERMAYEAAHADELRAAEEARVENRREKQAYAEKRARQRAILKQLRQADGAGPQD